jgi:UDP-N-acetylglucosamine:LPS N-acetylglucosamine transferase
MIVVAIIGLLAAIGIPSILGAYGNAQDNARLRNIAEAEKAKGVLTLPESSDITGAMGLEDTATSLDSGDPLAKMLEALSIDSKDELNVGDEVITFGDLTTKASYGAAVED